LNQSENQKSSANSFDANRSFVNIANWLRALGLNAPEVLAHDYEQGYLLVSDLGKKHYFDVYQQSVDDANRLFDDAVEALCVMQAGDYSSLQLPVFDAARTQEELDRCARWLVGEFLGDDIAQVFPLWPAVCETIVANIVEQPSVFVHLDYHSQNLLVCEPATVVDEIKIPNPGILDFQDALIGPVAYDIASYIRDIYIDWPPDQRQQWLQQYWQRAQALGVPVGDNLKQFQRWTDMCWMQRYIKCFGNFTRGHFQQDKSRYLQYLPSMIERVIDAASNYAEFDGLVTWLRDDVLVKVIDKNQTILGQQACT
ncbi:MAG: phosphotransferase, partial [Gammaproteobacteria bacterium]|nr:phosphotransferase [Gammaproteobacteria bacterium]